MLTNLVAIAYVVSGVFFIIALRGLSSPESSRKGNVFGVKPYTSLPSWTSIKSIVNDLGGETRQLSSASATSVLTILGVTILLLPVLRRTWKDFREKK